MKKLLYKNCSNGALSMQFRYIIYILYYKSKSRLSRIQIQTVQRIVTKFFTIIPGNLLKGLVPLLLG